MVSSVHSHCGIMTSVFLKVYLTIGACHSSNSCYSLALMRPLWIYLIQGYIIAFYIPTLVSLIIETKRNNSGHFRKMLSTHTHTHICIINNEICIIPGVVWWTGLICYFCYYHISTDSVCSFLWKEKRRRSHL